MIAPVNSIINWIKKNKITALLIVVVLFLLFKKTIPSFYSSSITQKSSIGSTNEMSYDSSLMNLSRSSSPAPEIKDRLVVKESFLSLLVDNVVDAQKKIIKKAESLGGYMVSSYLSNPQEAATGTVIVRIPEKKLDKTLDYYRSLSVKVISENLEGQDVTDQYVDIEARMNTLLRTKIKFEDILDKAVSVQDILAVQRELSSLQTEIDGLKGQEQYYQKSAQMAKLTLYLSTDELSLPYAPSESWRPNVIFKEAVRSLISFVRKLGSFAIWLVVFSIVWIPALFIFWLIFHKKKLK